MNVEIFYKSIYQLKCRPEFQFVWCVQVCVCVRVCYLAVHDEVADAAAEVFVLQLRVDVWDVLVHSAELQHLAHVQVSETNRGMRTQICIQTGNTANHGSKLI